MRNRLFYGDNLDNLRKKVRDETVDLCYIDPPFNSKRSYNQIYTNQGRKRIGLRRRHPSTPGYGTTAPRRNIADHQQL